MSFDFTNSTPQQAEAFIKRNVIESRRPYALVRAAYQSKHSVTRNLNAQLVRKSLEAMLTDCVEPPMDDPEYRSSIEQRLAQPDVLSDAVQPSADLLLRLVAGYDIARTQGYQPTPITSVVL